MTARRWPAAPSLVPWAVLVLILAASSARAQDESCTMADCEDCMDPGLQCAMCAPYHVPSADSKTCLACPGNCDICMASAGSGKCSSCAYGYYEASGGASCERCSAKCGECGEADVGSKCSVCWAGYHLLQANMKCKSCSANCVECIDSTQCLTCQTGFYLQNTGYTATCQACPGGVVDCEMCTDGTKCDQCKSGKYWDGSTCADCIDNCMVCTDSSTCGTCINTYVLSADSLCNIPKAHCSAVTEGTGCTECDQGYLLVDNMCQRCPSLETADTCNQCHSDSRGRFYDNTNKICDYCADDCLDCTSTDDCSTCVDGKVWDNVALACVGCQDDVASLSTADCSTCDGLYFDTQCHECPAALADKDGAEKCTGCATAEHGFFWATGTCTAVDCLADSVIEDDCGHCLAKHWDGDSCEDVVCDVTADLDTASKCVGCSTEEATKSWTPPVCEDVLCVGSLDDVDRCNACTDRYFNTGTGACSAIDCSNAAAFKNQAQCESCPGFYFDTNQCLEPDCSTAASLDSIETCVACRKHKLFWNDVAGSCDAVADCSAVADLTETGCNSCAMSEPWSMLRWNTEGDGSCEAIDPGVCTGDLSDATLANLEWLCVYCPNMMWAGDAETGTCEALNCYDPVTTQAPCDYCDEMYWDSSEGGGCTEVDCTGSLATESDCNACEGYLWVNEECAAQNCDSADPLFYALFSEAQCLSCPKRKWVLGLCADVDCTDLSSLSSMYDCVACGKYWNADTDTCTSVNCELDPLEDEMKCQACSNKYWEDEECKDKVDCGRAIIHSQERCTSCSSLDAPTVWDALTGKCYDCPENCAVCDEDMCTSCKVGYVWEGGACVECLGATLDAEETCTVCPGKFWSQSQKCEACPDACEDCTSKYLCTRCEVGKVWDNVAAACVGCVHEDEETCIQCGTSTRGNYFDADFCYACPTGCTDCDSTNCKECMNGYFLDKTDSDAHVCTVCATPFDSEEECSRCGGANTFWDSENEVCDTCMEECATCSSATACEDCPLGTYLNGESKCTNCALDCLVCTGDAECQQCQSNKYFLDTKCVNCPSHCADCNNPNGCNRCSQGYFLSEGECKACISGCAVCDDAETCKECNSGSCLDESGMACHVTTAKCKSCSQDAESKAITCNTCTDRHYLEECVACSMEGCDSCAEKNTECDKCTQGYYQDSTTCKKCPSFGTCAECTDGSACTRCHPGYYLDDKECKACGSGCAECADGDSCTRCSSLTTAWDETAKKCKVCMTNCAECSGPESCRVCVSGYFISESECSACPDHCAECTDGQTCTHCDHGYYKDSAGVCALCSESFPYCGMCDSAGTCQMCEYGYALTDDGMMCTACTVSQCSMCEDPSPRCDQCSTNFYPTYNHESCAPGCYVCEGADCAAAPGGNATVEACPGLGSTHFCDVVMDTVGDQMTHSRSCSNVTCDMSQPGEECVFKNQGENEVKSCRMCCADGKCNSQVLTGESAGGHAPHTVPMATLIITMATVAAIFCSKRHL